MDNIKESGEYAEFKAACKIWDKNAEVDIYLDGGLNKSNCELGIMLPKIDSILKKIPERDVTAKILKLSGMLDRAEEWVREGIPANEEEDCNVFITDDGVEVSLPISLEDFSKSMRLNSLCVTFDGSVENISASMYIHFSPDYFSGHSVEVEIKDGEIDCKGIVG